MTDNSIDQKCEQRRLAVQRYRETGELPNDPESYVSQLAHSRRAFVLLEELGTEPSVAYLKQGDSYVG